MKKKGLWFLLGAAAAGIGIGFYKAVSEAVSVKIVEDFNGSDESGTEPEEPEKPEDNQETDEDPFYDEESDLADDSEDNI